MITAFLAHLEQDREVADADLVEAYRRLALAESGVVALVRSTT